MQTLENLQIFTGAKFVPASDESSVIRGSNSRSRGIAGQHLASVAITVVVRDMCGCRFGAVSQEGLEIRAIILHSLALL